MRWDGFKESSLNSKMIHKNLLQMTVLYTDCKMIANERLQSQMSMIWYELNQQDLKIDT